MPGHPAPIRPVRNPKPPIGTGIGVDFLTAVRRDGIPAAS